MSALTFDIRDLLSQAPLNGWVRQILIKDRNMVVDINEIERCLRYFNSTNEATLTGIVWMRGNEPLTPEPFQLEEYRFMGLNNQNFPEVIGWMPDDIGIRVSTMVITKAKNDTR